MPRSLVIVLLVLARPAAAMPAPRVFPAAIDGPALSPAGVAEVAAEEARIACAAEEQLRCDVVVEWVLRGTGGGDVELAVRGAFLRHLAIAIDGAPTPLPPPPDDPPLPGRDLPVLLAPTLGIAPGEERRLVLHATASPPHTWHGGFLPVLSAVDVRHQLLAGRDEERSYALLVSPSPHRAADHRLTVAVEAPGLEIHAPDARPSGDRWLVEQTDSPVLLTLEDPEPTFVHGGPFVAFGAVVDGGDATFRMRAGYEVAAPRFVLYSLALETDCVDTFVVAPAVEAALPFVAILPSLGLGAGVPVRIEGGEARVGGRVQVSVAFPYLSLFVPLDFYPATSTTDPRFFEATVMAQLSF